MTFQLAIKSQFAKIFHKFSGFKLLKRKTGNQNGFVLMYHRVLEAPENEPVFVQPGMYVTTETIRQHVAFLKDNLQILSLKELVHRVRVGKSVQNCCAITLDDGWRDNYTRAYPVFREFEVPATIFLATGFINTNRIFWPEEFSFYLLKEETRFAARDKSSMLDHLLAGVPKNNVNGAVLDNCITALKALPEAEREDLLAELRNISPSPFSKRLLMTWDEAREIQASGLIDFGGHTANHVILDQVSVDNAEKEIVCSCRDLESHLGIQPELFAYPNGNYNEEIKNLLKKHGIKGAVTTKKGRMSGNSDLLEIPRIGMHEDISQTIPLFLGRIFLRGF